jgi:hypothetical protein
MKILLTLLAVTCLTVTGSQAQSSTTDYRPAVRHACRVFGLALTNSLVRVQAADGSAHVEISIPRFAKNLESAKISDCPQDFQLAWFDLSQAIRHYNKLHNAEHEAGAIFYGFFAVHGGGSAAANESAKQQSKVESKDDVETAYAALKRLKIKYLAPPSAP